MITVGNPSILSGVFVTFSAKMFVSLAGGLSYVQVDKHGITISYHLLQCRHCAPRAIIYHANVGKGGISSFTQKL